MPVPTSVMALMPGFQGLASSMMRKTMDNKGIASIDELRSLCIEADVKMVIKTAAPDGMIFDDKGNLYFADLENNKIQYLTPNGEINTLCEGEKIKWADTFSIYNGYLYFTNSRINETQNGVSDLIFSINKIKIED